MAYEAEKVNKDSIDDLLIGLLQSPQPPAPYQTWMAAKACTDALWEVIENRLRADAPDSFEEISNDPVKAGKAYTMAHLAAYETLSGWLARSRKDASEGVPSADVAQGGG